MKKKNETLSFRDNYNNVVSCQAGALVYRDVFWKLFEWYRAHYHTGEAIMQDDNSQLDAAALLAEIADNIICFKVEERDD